MSEHCDERNVPTSAKEKNIGRFQAYRCFFIPYVLPEDGFNLDFRGFQHVRRRLPAESMTVRFQVGFDMNFRKKLSSDIRIDPQNDIKIDPPPKGTKERHLTCRPGTAGRPWRGKARQMPFLAAAHPPVVYSKLPNADLVQVFGIKERQQPLHRLQ